MHKHSRNIKPTSGRFWLGFLFVFVSSLIVFVFQTSAYEFENKIEIEKSVEIGFDEKIIINFSFPVRKISIEDGITLSPSQEFSIKWENSNKRIVISPKNSWKSETAYVIAVNDGKDLMLRRINEEFKFNTKSSPKIISIFPSSGEKDVAIDMEQPVRVKLNSSIGEYNVKFVVNPVERLDWQINEDKTEIILLAKNNFKWNTNYTVGVFIKNKFQSSQEYVKIGETSFDTASPPIPETWDTDPKIRVNQAKNFTEAKLKTGKYIDINLSNQMMVIFENAVALDAYVISSGKRGMETPTGSFSIHNKAPRVWSKAYSLFMPYWMAIIPTGKIGIHELPEWPGGYKEGVNHLGQAVSHGCVRLGEGTAKRVYDWAEIGTPVVVY